MRRHRPDRREPGAEDGAGRATAPDHLTDQPLSRQLLGWFLPFNLLGVVPAAGIPCGFTDNGLPVGLQLVGRRHADPPC